VQLLRIWETETPDEIMRRAHKQIDTALAQDVLERVRAAPPEFFERLIVNLLPSMGDGGSRADKAGRALGRSGDDGVDGVIDQDALGLDRVNIQAKRYAAGNNIGPGQSAISLAAWTATKRPRDYSSRLRRFPPLQRKPQSS
jgi:restriction system protein